MSSFLSLAVYLVVSVLAGTFFVACAYFADAGQSWGREGRWVSGFLYVYALSLAGGLAIQIAAALLLRWLTRATGANNRIHWMVLGAALGIALPWACARLGYVLEGIRFPYEWQNVKSALIFPLMAAMMYETHPVWVRLAIGAATGGTVRIIFGPPGRRPS